MVSVCLPSDALLQHLLSYLGFSYLGRGVSPHGCSSKAQLLLLTLDEVALLTLNVNILGVSKLKWTGMGEFNSDDHYICYCRHESLRRNGVAIMVNKRV